MKKSTLESRKHEFFVQVMENPMSTEGEIARGVGLVRSPYSRKILFALVEEGTLRRAWDDHSSPGRFVYYVQLTDEMPL
jgi:hypothetical protein